MTKTTKALFIIDTLNYLFPNPQPSLLYKDEYTLLIAVMLSARCTDKRVNQISPLLFQKADTPDKMIQLTIEQIQTIIRPVGLSPQKAKGIWGSSAIILEKHKGKVPNTLEELEKLPAVGHKTASVVLCQAFGKAAFPVDTHIQRLIQRWNISPQGASVIRVEKDAKQFFPKKTWIKLHLQLIYYARAYSPAKCWDLEKDIITKHLYKCKNIY